MSSRIEIQRDNVTVAQFFSYIKRQCAKKGIDFCLDLDIFISPPKEYFAHHMIVGDVRKCHFEEYHEPEWNRWDYEESAENAPCKVEIVKSFAYDTQTYVLGRDGSCYNEICEFTFDDENLGHGYYFQNNYNPTSGN